MSELFEFKNEIRKQMQQSAALADQLGFSSSAQTIRGAKKEFAEKELMVVAVGEMKRGKSSMLNALLGEKIFPVDTSVATNVVTIVRYGRTEKVEALLEERDNDRVVPVVKTITRAQIPDYVSEQGNPANFKNVKLLNVEIANPLLQEGVVFVDTPGVGSLNISHAETTYGFLPNADLLLFVSDASAGLTETELDFLKRGYRYCKNVLYPLTKKDLNPDYQEIMQDNRRKVSAALGIAEDEVTVVPISNSAKLRYLETKSPAMLASSNYAEFERVIWSAIAAKRGEIMFLPFVEQVRCELYKMADAVAAQYQLLDEDKEKLSSLVEELNREIGKYNALKQEDAVWKKELSQFFSLMQNNNSSVISQIKLKARTCLDERVAELGVKICEEKQYTKVYNEINSLISQELLNMKETMRADTVAEVDRINESLGLQVDSCRAALDHMEFTPKEKMEVTFPKRKKGDILMAGGRKVGMSMMGASKVGMIAGAVVGTGLAIVAGPAILAAELGTSAAVAVIAAAVGAGSIGTTAGSIVGGAKGCIDAVRTGRDVDIPIVQKAFYNHIESSMILVSKTVSDGFITLRNAVINNLEEELGKKAQELKDDIDQIKENIASTKSDTEKLADLKSRAGMIEKQLACYDRMEERIASMGAPQTEKKEAAEDNSQPEYSFL